MEDTHDWFHAILLFLYEKPFDGATYSTKEIGAKISGFNGKETAHLNKLANVIALLEERNYIKHSDVLSLILTPEGYDYMLQRKRDKRQDILYWIPIAISIVAAFIAFLSYQNNVEKATLKQQLQEQSVRIKQLQNTLSQKEGVQHPNLSQVDSLKNLHP